MINDTSKLAAPILLTLLFASGCTAHYPVNSPLHQIDIGSGYRTHATEGRADCSDSLMVVLAFSGGGTRAAAFSYGVLETMRDITIEWEGCSRQLLNEIDTISAVSGGSFTAAYFGLFGERIFEDYEDKFLNADVQGYLTWSLFRPWNWFRLGSSFFGRSEFAADYYDKILFEGKTFADLMIREGPVIQINATEVSTGTQFTFMQDWFDPLCSDLASFSIARAVTASSAVPVLFSSITINNYAGSCDYQLAPRAIAALNDLDPTSRRRHLARKYTQYLDRELHPYLHLYDGGLTDNLGVRPPMNRLELAGGGWELAKLENRRELRKLLFVIVNSQAESKTGFSLSASSVPLLDTILGATSIPLNELTFESLAAVKTQLDAFKRQYADGRCADLAERGENTAACDDLKAYLVIVDLDQVSDSGRRSRLKQIPTSFVLKPEQVDELRDAARTVLLSSKEFQRFLDDTR